jgi:hypothetical protein
MPASKTSSTGRVLVTVVMDILIAVVVALVVHLIVYFFGTLSGNAWGAGLLKLTRLAVIPMGFKAVPTPYGGVFDINAAGTMFLLLALEWVLGVVRRTV